jgi:hypothetical protein
VKNDQPEFAGLRARGEGAIDPVRAAFEPWDISGR